jgi:hypothetical protein
MAPTRKSAKRAGKKRSGAKRASAKKRPSRKAASKRSTKTVKRARKTSPLKRRAEQGLKAARGGLDTVREAGERTWEVLKSTTSQMVEGVKDRLAEDSNGEGEYRDRFAR